MLRLDQILHENLEFLVTQTQGVCTVLPGFSVGVHTMLIRKTGWRARDLNDHLSSTSVQDLPIFHGRGSRPL